MWLDPAQLQLKLKHMLDARLIRFREDIWELLTAAAKEGEIENRLQRLRDDFAHRESSIETIKSRGEVVLKSGKTGNLMAGIEDGQLVLTALLGNRDNGAFRREIRTGTARLATV